MIHYHTIERDNFSKEDFNLQIEKAKKTIQTEFELTEENFKDPVRFENKTYLVSGENFIGTYITYEIFNDNNFIGSLNCFMNNEKTFIEIHFM